MMIKRGKIWHCVTKVNGRKISRSTGETDKLRAEAKAQEFQEALQLLRKWLFAVLTHEILTLFMLNP
jgi:hypothetical protein